MSLRIRVLRDAGETLVATIERLSDGMVWGGTAFAAAGSAPALIPLKPSAAPWTNRYEALVATAGWPDGNYAVHVHHLIGTAAAPPLLMMGATLYNGDDAPPPPAVVTVNVPTGTTVKTGP